MHSHQLESQSVSNIIAWRLLEGWYCGSTSIFEVLNPSWLNILRAATNFCSWIRPWSCWWWWKFRLDWWRPFELGQPCYWRRKLWFRWLINPSQLMAKNPFLYCKARVKPEPSWAEPYLGLRAQLKFFESLSRLKPSPSRGPGLSGQAWAGTSLGLLVNTSDLDIM